VDTSAPTLDQAPLSPTDARWLSEAIALSQEAREAGRHPFAAIVVTQDGGVVGRAMNNSTGPDGDPTQHAELIAVAEAARMLSPEAMRSSTLYSSAEPCAMCAGATYWTGVGRVVYALSEHRLLGLTGDHPENPTLRLPCRDVFAAGQRSVEVVGPALEDEAAQIHTAFWTRTPQQPST
jgi:tRNA(Arg) A34 adenosine deaminase TadA